ncbi:DNA-binding domain-containing protein [Aliiroseovarius sp. YM-037]|uniref:HvfC/BufC N-terminal domain-containing protein n=1 Tax=Aliiroseovarius sp. YM-037 TaxID=3341728 RepID=UPI003A80616A
MSVDQTRFTTALLDPECAVPDGLTDPEGRPAGKRFAVYRNNVAVSLTEALITAFPVIYKLVGDAFFRAMAGVYLRQHPPKSALMMFYGAEMPEFLADFEPAQHLGYLPDIARLELAMRASYHAADATPIAPDALQSLPADRLMSARIGLAPAARLIRSPWPIHAIWRANMVADAPKPTMRAEDALITRAEFDPTITALPPGGGAFVEALMSDATFGDALDAATAEAETFDLTPVLGALLSGAALISIKEGDPA